MDKLNDIVFEKRNRAYGAYRLRRMNSNVLNLSTLISVFSFCALFLCLYIYYNLPEETSSDEYYYDSSVVGNPYQPDIIVLPEPAGAKKSIAEQIPKVVNEIWVQDTMKKNTAAGQDSGSMASGHENRKGNGGGKGDSLSLSELNFNAADANKFNIMTHIGIPPRFPGGERARERFLQKNITYPEFAQKNKIEGPVYVTFIVEPDSTLTNIRILQGIGAKCDEEALRVVRIMPKWIPGTKNGVPVRFQITMPLIFTLHSL